MMARDLINSISVAEGDSLPNMLLISEKPSMSFFLASTCIKAVAWYTGVANTAYAVPTAMEAAVIPAINHL
ncbi:hypothetical protein D3C87_1877360 [compost metagenome]